jgi:hypothetical protein
LALADGADERALAYPLAMAAVVSGNTSAVRQVDLSEV